jgi:transposase
MRTPGSPQELEYRRRLAVQRVRDGYGTEEVADFLGVHPASVRRWVATARRLGPRSLTARPPSGGPRKLTHTQEKVVRRWLRHSPSEHGFLGDLWSAPRLAQVIHREFGVSFHPRYLARWLRARGFTPQMPRRLPRERNRQRLDDWLARDWPRIRKRPGGEAQASS